jgi:hypothetical protein
MPVFRNLATNPAFESAQATVETSQGTRPIPDGVTTAGDAEAWQAEGVGVRRQAALAIRWLSYNDFRLVPTGEAGVYNLTPGVPGTYRETREQGVYDILPGGQLTPTADPNDYRIGE